MGWAVVVEGIEQEIEEPCTLALAYLFEVSFMIQIHGKGTHDARQSTSLVRRYKLNGYEAVPIGRTIMSTKHWGMVSIEHLRVA